jgi:hypothetical protein
MLGAGKKRLLTVFVVVIQYHSTIAQINPFYITFSDSGLFCSGTGLCQLPSGNLLYAGYAYAAGIPSYIVLKKLTADGTTISSVNFPAPNGAYSLNKFFYDSQNFRIYLAGHYADGLQTDAIVLIADTSGNLLANHFFGQNNTSESINGICPTTDGGFAAIGYQGAVSSNTQFYLVKADANGQLQWEQTYGSTFHDMGMNVIQTPDMGFMLTGDMQVGFNSYYNVLIIKTDASGSEQWSLPVTWPFNSGCRDMIRDSYGHFIVTGETATPTSAYFDIMLIKFDISGDLFWIKTLAATDQGDAGFSISEFQAGHYLLTGYHFVASSNNTAVFMAHTDTAGDAIDFRIYDFIPMIDIGYQIYAVTNGFYIAGTSIWVENKYILVFDTLNLGTDLPDMNSSSVLLYPNPLAAGSTLRLESHHPLQQAVLTTMNGQKICQWLLTGTSHRLQLPDGLPAGIYPLLISHRQGIAVHRLVIMPRNQ